MPKLVVSYTVEVKEEDFVAQEVFDEIKKLEDQKKWGNEWAVITQPLIDQAYSMTPGDLGTVYLESEDGKEQIIIAEF